MRRARGGANVFVLDAAKLLESEGPPSPKRTGEAPLSAAQQFAERSPEGGIDNG